MTKNARKSFTRSLIVLLSAQKHLIFNLVGSLLQLQFPRLKAYDLYIFIDIFTTLKKIWDNFATRPL